MRATPSSLISRRPSPPIPTKHVREVLQIYALISVEDDEELTRKLVEDTQPSRFIVEKNYKGPHLSLPLDKSQIANMIEAFKLNKVSFCILSYCILFQVLHPRYVLLILHEARRILKTMPSIIHFSTSIANQITICGDLHGKFDDLCIILYKVGSFSPFPDITGPFRTGIPRSITRTSSTGTLSTEGGSRWRCSVRCSPC